MLDIEKIKKNIAKLEKLSPTEWDKICKRCGLCCLNKIDDAGHIYYSNYTCQHFDLKSKCCNCYRQRLKCANCEKLTLAHILEGRLMPDSCAYAERIFGPAKYTPTFDWQQIKNINSVSFKNAHKITTSVISSSIYWSARYNFGNDMFPGYDEIQTLKKS